MDEMEPEMLTGKPEPLPKRAKTNGEWGGYCTIFLRQPKPKISVPPFQWTNREEGDRSRMIHLGRPSIVGWQYGQIRLGKWPKWDGRTD